MRPPFSIGPANVSDLLAHTEAVLRRLERAEADIAASPTELTELSGWECGVRITPAVKP